VIDWACNELVEKLKSVARTTTQRYRAPGRRGPSRRRCVLTAVIVKARFAKIICSERKQSSNRLPRIWRVQLTVLPLSDPPRAPGRCFARIYYETPQGAWSPHERKQRNRAAPLYCAALAVCCAICRGRYGGAANTRSENFSRAMHAIGLSPPAQSRLQYFFFLSSRQACRIELGRAGSDFFADLRTVRPRPERGGRRLGGKIRTRNGGENARVLLDAEQRVAIAIVLNKGSARHARVEKNPRSIAHLKARRTPSCRRRVTPGGPALVPEVASKRKAPLNARGARQV